jgi:hypothetical protein
MAFSEALAARIRDALVGKRGVEEKKMFGGVGSGGRPPAVRDPERW